MLGVINRMAKKFNYKLPSMVALTLVGSAVTAHQVQAARRHKIKLLIKTF